MSVFRLLAVRRLINEFRFGRQLAERKNRYKNRHRSRIGQMVRRDTSGSAAPGETIVTEAALNR